MNPFIYMYIYRYVHIYVYNCTPGPGSPMADSVSAAVIPEANRVFGWSGIGIACRSPMLCVF